MLKPRQMKLAELMAVEPELTKEEYAERIGCNASTVYAWRKLPEFQEYYHKLCEKRFRSFEGLAVQKLMENANKGNQKAIEYLLNYIGYTPTQKVDTKITGVQTISVNVEED